MDPQQGSEEEILAGIWPAVQARAGQAASAWGVAGIDPRGEPNGYQVVPASLSRFCDADLTHRSSPSPTETSL